MQHFSKFGPLKLPSKLWKFVEGPDVRSFKSGCLDVLSTVGQLSSVLLGQNPTIDGRVDLPSVDGFGPFQVLFLISYHLLSQVLDHLLKFGYLSSVLLFHSSRHRSCDQPSNSSTVSNAFRVIPICFEHVES
ncbi:hypothetical protein M9H77_03324 [Catharanthus roseus]|uniref:Uncharacterized protein n=1 Tax=Catharanthus roseus TaxID=4058 RepID=A0ACC0CAZ7_CATRO|nr:hypothetical protein M9H77_03324 [Catharanthus roseus]